MADDAVGFRVLVVEDEPLIGMDIEDAVEGLGHEVIGPIAELDEALEVAANAALGCAILDINIRGGHSYPVADMLLKRGLPVLLLSGYGEQTLPKRLQKEARLSKPFTGAQLDKEIRELCARAVNSGP
ncbi:response regulator [Phenylobacterium sp. 20VBR1]|uniref:Response regulator n=1 Tax=Phenylobacterium glaciei TaxID=2803784 RepID=A0A941D1E7_9CAUL|nr:response regulator [Phenylobacterium glaciei]MBR7619093.1 response regulator [Phenylobacterium glaciei]